MNMKLTYHFQTTIQEEEWAKRLQALSDKGFSKVDVIKAGIIKLETMTKEALKELF